MNADAFRLGLIALYGSSFRQAAARAFGVFPTTIDRWVTPEGKPNHAAPHPSAVKLLEHLQEAERRRVIQRSYEARYKRSKRKGVAGV